MWRAHYSKITGHCIGRRACGWTVPPRAVRYADRANVCLGSISAELVFPRHVRFTPGSDRTADIQERQLRAKTGSDKPYSITSTTSFN
jgi:hypothetical protein